MIWFYFDASALAKRYSKEAGTELINELFRRVAVKQMTCLMLGILEVTSILVRKKNDGRLSKAAFEQAMINLRSEIIDADVFPKATINDSLVTSALGLIAKHNINATDAVILRSVLNIKEALDKRDDQMVLLTSDKRLSKAAQSESVTVFDPEVETVTSMMSLFDSSRQE